MVQRVRKAGGVLTGYAVQAWGTDIGRLLPELGEEGWELVAISDRANIYGESAAGLTTDEVLVFKRSRP